jgi:hypothetical protein
MDRFRETTVQPHSKVSNTPCALPCFTLVVLQASLRRLRQGNIQRHLILSSSNETVERKNLVYLALPAYGVPNLEAEVEQLRSYVLILVPSRLFHAMPANIGNFFRTF